MLLQLICKKPQIQIKAHFAPIFYFWKVPSADGENTKVLRDIQKPRHGRLEYPIFNAEGQYIGL
jgi:hypothetical protein